MVNEEIKYDLRILSCFNLLFEIKNMMYSGGGKENCEITKDILDDFEKKFYSHLKLICYKAFVKNNSKYLSSTKLIQRIYDLNQNLEEQRDNLIPFIRDSLTTMEKNLMTLYKLVPISLVNGNGKKSANGSGRKKRLSDEKRAIVNVADEKISQNFEVISKEINFSDSDSPKNEEEEEVKEALEPASQNMESIKDDFIDNKAQSIEKIKKKIEQNYRKNKNKVKVKGPQQPINPNESLDTIDEVNSVGLSSSRISRGINSSFITADGVSPKVANNQKGSAICAMETFKPQKIEKTPVKKIKKNPLKKQFKSNGKASNSLTVKLFLIFRSKSS